MFAKNKLSSAILAATAVMVYQPSVAQSTGADEEVLVTGIRGSLERAVDIKREASGVVDAISSEDIGKFPDTNLAESLQRITGVSIDRSGGEGQSITVRGFGPQFNTVVVNGRRLASESETRGFSFDTFASEMVSSLNVHKTAEASLPSGGIGSTVNIKTPRPLESPGFKLAGSLKANYEDKSEETSPHISALFSNTFADDTVGVLVAASQTERNTRIDQAQTNQWQGGSSIPTASLAGNTGAAPILAPQNFDQRVLFEERTRTNANLVVQFAPNENLTITGDVIYSDFDIEGEATSYGHWFTPSNFTDVSTDANGTVTAFAQAAGQATDFHSKTNDRLTETTSFGFNVNFQATENLNLQFDLWQSEAEREPNNGNRNNMVLGYLRGASYLNDGSDLPSVFGFEEGVPDVAGNLDDGFPNTGGFLDTVGDPGTHAVGDYLDPSNPRAHVAIRGGESTGLAIQDEVTEIKFAGEWDEGSDSGLVKARFGAGINSETRDIDGWDNTTRNGHNILAGYLETGDVTAAGVTAFDIPDSVFEVFDAGSDFLTGLSQAGSERMPARWLYARDNEALFDIFEQETGIDHDANMTGSSITVEEEVTFAYLELDFASEVADMPLTATAGVRIESTDITVDGTNVPLEDVVANAADQTQFNAITGDPQAVQATNDHEALLPNLSVNLEITENLVARFGASQTLTRPTLRQLAPAINIGTTRPGNLTASSGNPQLKPFSSDNLDLSLEYYFGEASYVSFGYFQKNVSDFIINGSTVTTFNDSNGNEITQPIQDEDGLFTTDGPKGPAPFTLALPTNGEDDVKVDGIEVAFQHTLDMGLGFIVNATFVNSDAEFDVNDFEESFAVTGISDSANAVIFYENGPFSGRLAYNWRDEFLQSLTQSAGAGEPVFVEAYSQVDLSASYDITENVTVFLEGINLTEEIVLTHGRFDNQFLDASDSGRRFLFGVRGSF